MIWILLDINNNLRNILLFIFVVVHSRWCCLFHSTVRWKIAFAPRVKGVCKFLIFSSSRTCNTTSFDCDFLKHDLSLQNLIFTPWCDICWIVYYFHGCLIVECIFYHVLLVEGIFASSSSRLRDPYRLSCQCTRHDMIAYDAWGLSKTVHLTQRGVCIQRVIFRITSMVGYPPSSDVLCL